MTMPYGSVEEPEVEIAGSKSNPVHVVSTDAKPTKQIGTEFGRWRTVIVSNVIGQSSVTPGAQRLLNRSLRRKRARIIVNASTGATGQSVISPANPAAGTPFTYTNTTGQSQGLVAAEATLTTDATVANRFPRFQILDASGNILAIGQDGTAVVASSVIIVNCYQGATQQNSAAGTTTLPLPQNIQIPPGGQLVFTGQSGAADQWSNIHLTFTNITQSSQDGVIIGSREEITSGQPAIPGQLGGYLQIGDNLNYEAQPELWVCFPSTNIGSVLVTVCDEVYASDSE